MSQAGIDAIVKSNVPVLCLDTCTVLDLLRFTKQPKSSAREHSSALKLLTAAEDENKLAILIANQVSVELNTVLKKIACETKKTIAELKQKLCTIEAVALVHGGKTTSDLHHIDNFVSIVQCVITRYTSVATLLKQSDRASGRAIERSNLGKAPAQKGQRSLEDCVIIETYFEAVQQLRHEGHNQPIVFVSSDLKDYAKPGCPSMLRPKLDQEFVALNLEFAPNLAAAKHHLGV